MKKNIAIVAGGDSSEFPVSMNSARTIRANLDAQRYNAYMIIVRGNEWYMETDKGQKRPVNKDDFSIVVDGKPIRFDCAFIIIHGTPGENGVLQGYFETLRIPYTTSGVLASSLTFNKLFSKRYISGFDVDVSNYYYVYKDSDWDSQGIAKGTGLPCFVKPNRGGSSFGVTKVSDEEALAGAIEKAFEEDYEVLVEEYLEGTELTCGLIKSGGKEWVFPPTEIVSKNEFFDYEAKYTKGMADEITPARISGELDQRIRQLSSRLYDLFNCRGIVRIDYIYAHDRLYFMEVNTIPGMSAASIVPQQIEAMGYSLEQMFTLAIEDAITHNQKEGLRK